jgi:hypothetical protein
MVERTPETSEDRAIRLESERYNFEFGSEHRECVFLHVEG